MKPRPAMAPDNARRNAPTRSHKRAAIAACALACLAAVGVATANRDAKPRMADGPNAMAQRDAASDAVHHLNRDALSSRASNGADAAAREHIVDDPDGDLLWASPTEGSPIALRYAPPGTQCLIHVRLAQLTAHPEGPKALAALGPWGEVMLDRLRSLTGAEASKISSVSGFLVVRSDGQLDVCLRVEFATSPGDGFPQIAAGATSVNRAGAECRVAADQAFIVPERRANATESEGQRELIICPPELAETLVDSQGEPPLLIRGLEELVAHSDADRMATLVMAPKFFDAAGGQLLAGPARGLDAALQYFAHDEVAAASLSLHWDDNFFVELRAAPVLDVSPRRMSALLYERTGALSATVDAFVQSRDWPPYGRDVVKRFPAMLHKLHALTRRGEEFNHAVLRAYLPLRAGHNLLAAAELALTQQLQSRPP